MRPADSVWLSLICYSQCHQKHHKDKHKKNTTKQIRLIFWAARLERENSFPDGCIFWPVVSSGEWREAMGGRPRMQHVLILANKGVVSLFSFSIVYERPGRREVLAFCAAFVPWPAEWPSGKPEWAGGGAISSIRCHSVSSTGIFVYLRDMDTSLFPLLDLILFFPPFCVFVFVVLCFKLTTSHDICHINTLVRRKNKMIWDDPVF